MTEPAGRRARLRAPRSRGQRGFTLIEMVIATALVTVVTLVSLSSLTSMGRASNRGVGEQEVARMGGSLLQRVARELRYADAGTILYSPLEPDRLTFQEVLAYESDPSTDGDVVLSRPITLRRIALAGGAGFGVERSESNTLIGTALVTICQPNGEGAPQTLTVCVADLEPYLRDGATLGPCGQEPTPVSSSAYAIPTRVLGQVAERDASDPTLPGLHFGVRTAGDRTFVDIAVTVTARAGGEVVTRRFSTSVALVNR